GRQISRRAPSPRVATLPSGSIGTAVTAPSWKRSTSVAALRSSDQRMTDVSKLPDTADLPSGAIASARTGPPWPRSCACATPAAHSNTTNATVAGERRIIEAISTFNDFHAIWFDL